MFSSIIGKKIGYTRIFDDQGNAVPVTVIQAGPCKIVNIKTLEKDGYEAVQLGYVTTVEGKLNKPLVSYFKKQGVELYKHLKEFRSDNIKDVKINDIVTVETFTIGELVSVSGFSKGKGFQGVVKRYGFHGGPGSHGSMFHRQPGSIGSNTFPGRVIKNKKLPGRMGNVKTTIKNLKVVKLIPEKNVILIRGAVPGSVNTLIEIKKVQA
ncbi:MAG: 50S ribosomal protein L3 [Deltaproteobacteria bacterium]|nr:50S ribosomal protein L3 [Deltaproteobacteria bacterium]MCL5791695.1 50S ribosomal protein L3 [Deltaproteobacteria bacterium]